MIVISNKVGEDTIFQTNTVSVPKNETLEISFKIEEIDAEDFLVKVRFIENPDEGVSVKSEISPDGEYLTVNLINIPDGPGSIQKPLKIIENKNNFDIFLDIKSGGLADGKYLLTYSLSKKPTTADKSQ